MKKISELVPSISDSLECLFELNLNEKAITYYSAWNNHSAPFISSHFTYLNTKNKPFKNFLNFICAYLKHSNCFEDEYSIKTQNNEMKWVVSRWKVIKRDQAHNPIYIVGSFVDISEKKQIEDKLKQSELLYQNLFNSISLGLLHLDKNGKVIQANKTAESFLNMSSYDMKGKILSSFLKAVSEKYIPLQKGEYPSDTVISDPSKSNTMVLGIHNNTQGDFYWLSVDAVPICNERKELCNINIVMRDISDLKRHEKQQLELEKQLLFSQKMESIGRLAGGIAHDFNNYLTTILGYTELAMLKIDKKDKSYEYLDVVLNSSNRASNLTRQLLAFSRPKLSNPIVVDVNSVIIDMKKIVKRLIHENIEIRYDLTKTYLKVRIDPGHIEQIILNLVGNARDAIADTGTITIQTSKKKGIHEYTDLKQGEYVRISVKDTGNGICEEDKQHIFEPFYTTKEENKGTGLGLSICYGIVKSNKGDITFHSEIGKGTTFNVFLPVTMEQKNNHESTHTTSLSLNTDDVICVVEDDVEVRNVIVNTLENIGFTVYQARNGVEAIERVSNINKIDFLITDVIMPKMGGTDLYTVLKQRYPNLKVLFISGYADVPNVNNTKGCSSNCLLQKPFSPHDLIAKIVENTI